MIKKDLFKIIDYIIKRPKTVVIILQKKDIDPSTLVYEAGAILLLAIAIVILKFRRSKLLGIKFDKDEL